MSMTLLGMRWSDVWFAHWAVDPATVEAQLPAGLTADTYEGEAYLGVVGFQMEQIRPRGIPFGLSFPELNLRTYVDGPAGPGIYFFSLDAGDWLGVTLARQFFHLPYYRASMHVEETADGTRFRSHRTHRNATPMSFEGTYRPEGTPEEADPGTLDAFLAERYRFYAASDGQLYDGPVEHQPWKLQPATIDIERNDLFDTNGFEQPAGDPLVHYSPGVTVTASALRPVS